ncbi:hypothetical protein [Parapedobacter deserti]
MALTLSDRIDADGSTPPYTFTMLNLRNKITGESAPAEFFTDYEVLMFKSGSVFDPSKDTTVELLNKKRELVNTTPMVFNETSGQIAFNRASANLTLGEYVFDVEMSNSWGKRLFKDFAQINVVDPLITDMFQVTYQAATGSTAAEVFTTINAPQLSCTKISNEGARVILKIVDKNGNPWNPRAGEVIRRGDRPTFESHVKFNPVIETDTALICDFEVAPFPLTNLVGDDGTDWAFLIYYRIPMQFAQIDGVPSNNVNPVFGFRVLMEGTYVVQVKLPDVTRISGATQSPGTT